MERHDHNRPIMTNGESALITDLTTWTTYAKAKASTAGDGLGFVLDGDGIAGRDFNHCANDGVLTLGSQAILGLLPDTNAELSPSGHGVRMFCYANIA
jgi:primase-polymerase (primpol)-like protein